MAKTIVLAFAVVAVASGALAQQPQRVRTTPVVVAPQQQQVQIVREKEQALGKLSLEVLDEAKQKATWSGMLDSVVTGAPYSATATNESVQTLSDGNRIVHRSVSNVSRDSQGRVRREELDENMNVKSIMILDPVGKATYMLDPATRTARKISLMLAAPVVVSGTMVFRDESSRSGGASVAVGGVSTGATGGNVFVYSTATPAAVRKQAEVRTESLGTQVVGGVAAEGTRTTRTIAAGEIGNERPIEIVDEEWYSKDLQTTVSSRHSDPRTGETTYRVSNLRRDEPDPALFQVPADYTIKADEVKWSVVSKEPSK